MFCSACKRENKEREEGETDILMERETQRQRQRKGKSGSSITRLLVSNVAIHSVVLKKCITEHNCFPNQTKGRMVGCMTAWVYPCSFFPEYHDSPCTTIKP